MAHVRYIKEFVSTQEITTESQWLCSEVQNPEVQTIESKDVQEN